MTRTLQQAIAAIEKLPEDVQDAIAARLLQEVADEQGWAARFEATTDAQWDHLAKKTRRAIREGPTTTPLEDAFPPSSLA